MEAAKEACQEIIAALLLAGWRATKLRHITPPLPNPEILVSPELYLELFDRFNFQGQPWHVAGTPDEWVADKLVLQVGILETIGQSNIVGAPKESLDADGKVRVDWWVASFLEFTQQGGPTSDLLE